MEKIINMYMDFILSTRPSKSWKVIRFFLHWISLPIKLILIGSLGIFQIVYSKIFTKNRKLENEQPSILLRRKYFNKIFKELPILNTTEFQCYVNQVPDDSEPNGYNHNTDHQCSRHSTYYFLMNKLDMANEKMKIATQMHMQGKWLVRGFKKEPDKSVEFNIKTVSGDMLCGLNLAIMAEDSPNENFDHIVAAILENDYALLEGHRPEDGSPGDKLYTRLLKENDYRFEKVPMKSSRGMWQPGLETVGAQALTILSALRVAEIKNGNREAGKEYRKLLWKYGYGLLSLFPTAYIDSSRGYFNDHNCMISLYVLSKLSKSKLGKLFWKIPMLYVWLLSKHWYNGYFTGLLRECYPESVSKEYVDVCKRYLYEVEPVPYFCSETEEIITKDVPSNYININADEFSPDTRHDRICVLKSGTQVKYYKSGLGFIASAIMLEDLPKELLELKNM